VCFCEKHRFIRTKYNSPPINGQCTNFLFHILNTVSVTMTSTCLSVRLLLNVTAHPLTASVPNANRMLCKRDLLSCSVSVCHIRSSNVAHHIYVCLSIFCVRMLPIQLNARLSFYCNGHDICLSVCPSVHPPICLSVTFRYHIALSQ